MTRRLFIVLLLGCAAGLSVGSASSLGLTTAGVLSVFQVEVDLCRDHPELCDDGDQDDGGTLEVGLAFLGPQGNEQSGLRASRSFQVEASQAYRFVWEGVGSVVPCGEVTRPGYLSLQTEDYQAPTGAPPPVLICLGYGFNNNTALPTNLSLTPSTDAGAGSAPATSQLSGDLVEQEPEQEDDPSGGDFLDDPPDGSEVGDDVGQEDADDLFAP